MSRKKESMRLNSDVVSLGGCCPAADHVHKAKTEWRKGRCGEILITAGDMEGKDLWK